VSTWTKSGAPWADDEWFARKLDDFFDKEVRLVDRQNAAQLAEEALKHTAMVTGDAGFDRGIFCLLRFNLQ
jgi:hypothetical protein